MLNDILWQAEELVTLTVAGEGSQDFEITARPVVFSYFFGITPGLLLVEEDRIGWWYSGNVTSLMKAWQVAQLLPKANRIRERRGGYDQTLCGLVIAIGRGDRHEQRIKNLGIDFGLTPEQMIQLLQEAGKTGPKPEELEVMLEKLGGQINDRADVFSSHLTSVEQAHTEGWVEFTPRVQELVEAAQYRRDAHERQMERDEVEIEEAVDPANSFAMLAADLAIHNFRDYDPDWGWGEIKPEELDHRIKLASIGRWAYRDGLVLQVSEKSSDDPTAYYSSTTTDGAVTIFSSNFGQISAPFVEVGDQRLIFHRVRYHRGGMFWVNTTIQPQTVETQPDDDSQAVWMQIPEIRWTIGHLLGLESVELPVGLSLQPMVESAPAALKARRRRGRK